MQYLKQKKTSDFYCIAIYLERSINNKTMEMSVKERLKLFLREESIKDTDFCRTIGVSTGFISGMRVSIQPDKLKSIAINFPRLDIGWLLTGEGSMLKNESSSTSASFPEETQNKKKNSDTSLENGDLLYKMYIDIQKKDAEIKELHTKLLSMSEEIGNLKTLLKDKQHSESLTTNSDSHVETVQKKRSSSRISGSSAQPDAPAIK